MVVSISTTKNKLDFFLLLETVNNTYFVILKIESLKFQILIAIVRQPLTPEM